MIWSWVIGNAAEVIAGLASFAGVVLAAMFGRERGKRKQTERDLKASQDIRKKEKDVRNERDDELVDRLSRNGM